MLSPGRAAEELRSKFWGWFTIMVTPLDSFDLAAHARFLFELHHRQEEVDVEVHDGIEAIE